MATNLTFKEAVAVLPASDLDRARQFYTEKLGLSAIEGDLDGLFFRIGSNSAILVYQAAGPASGQHTQAGLLVDDLDAAMSELKSRGVTFEEYDIPGIHTEGGVVTLPTGRGAFFKDSEGNILALNDPSPEARAWMGV